MVSGTINNTRDLTKHIEAIAHNEKLNDFDYDVVNMCEKGDNYVGDVFRVIIKGVKNEKNAKLSLIFKQLTEDKVASYQQFHTREIETYKHVIPQLEKFQNEHNVSPEYRFVFVKCFYNADEVIVFQDLCEIGCKIADKYIAADCDHASKVMMNFGKLHGLSFAMQHINPIIFNDITKNHFDICWQPDFMEGYGNGLKALYNNSLRFIKNEIGRKKLEEFKNEVEILMGEYCKQREHSVISHGDSWSSNILFNYKDHKPIDVFFVDWQLSRYCSPVIDIVYYIYLCTDSKLRRNHYKQLQKLYHNTLANTLKDYGLNVKEIYNYETFQKDLNDLSKFGLFSAMILLRVMTVKPEYVLDLDTLFKTDSGLSENPSEGLKLYEQRLNEVVEDFITFGLL